VKIGIVMKEMPGIAWESLNDWKREYV